MLSRSLPILAAFIWTSMVGPSSAVAQITSVTWVKWNPATSGSSSGMTSFPALSVIQCAVVCSADSQCSHFYFDGVAKTCQLRSYRAGSDGEKDVSNYQRQAAPVVPCPPHSDFYKVEGGDACIRVYANTPKAISQYSTVENFCAPNWSLLVFDQHKIDNITAVLQGLGLYTMDIWLGAYYSPAERSFHWYPGGLPMDMSLIKDPLRFNMSTQVCLAFRANRVNKIYYQLCNVTLPLACQLPLP